MRCLIIHRLLLPLLKNYTLRRSLDLREEYPRNGNGGGLPDSSRHLRVPELRPEIPSIREEEAALRRSQEEGLMVRRPLALDSSGEPAVTDSLASWPSAPNLHTSVSPKPQDMDVSVGLRAMCVVGWGRCLAVRQMPQRVYKHQLCNQLLAC